MRILHIFDHSVPLHSGYTFRSLSILRRQRARGWHAHSPVQNAMAAIRAGKKLGLPVVYEVRAFWEDAAVAHGTFHRWGFRYQLAKWMETRAMRRADVVTTICEGLRGDMINRGVPPGKVTVIPNAVEPDAFWSARQPDVALRREMGLDGKKVLGFIGSFYGYEGLDLLIDALPAISRGAPDVRLVMVGGGPQEAKLEQQVATLDLKDMVRFTGRVPHDQVARYYSVIDGFIYPRRRMRLTDLVTPLKPLEAMAGRKFVMASDVGGHRELVDHGINGRLFEPDSSASIADAVIAWAGNDPEMENMLDAAERLVTQTRNWEASVALYEGVYARIYGKADIGDS